MKGKDLIGVSTNGTLNDKYIFVGGRVSGKTKDLIDNLHTENKLLANQLQQYKQANEKAIEIIKNTPNYKSLSYCVELLSVLDIEGE